MRPVPGGGIWLNFLPCATGWPPGRVRIWNCEFRQVSVFAPSARVINYWLEVEGNFVG